jgi:hypothetical protein
MSLGLGIFLSALVFAVIYLYRITRDRWNWRKIARRLAFGVLLFVFLIVTGGLGFYLWNNRITNQTEYAGLRLGMTKAEVKYVKGNPTSLYKENPTSLYTPSFIEPDKLVKGIDIEDFDEWLYLNESIDLVFDKQKRTLIAITCYSIDWSTPSCPAIAGITDGDSEKDLTSKFGQPSTATIDGNTKTVRYENIGAVFSLAQQTINSLGIYNAQAKATQHYTAYLEQKRQDAAAEKQRNWQQQQNQAAEAVRQRLQAEAAERQRLQEAQAAEQRRIQEAQAAYAIRHNNAVRQFQILSHHLTCAFSWNCLQYKLAVEIKNNSQEIVSAVSVGWAILPNASDNCPSSLPTRERAVVNLRSGDTTALNFDGFDGLAHEEFRYCVLITDAEIVP